MSATVDRSKIPQATFGARLLAGNRLSPWRLLKLLGAVAVLSAGAYAVASDQLSLTTDNAVVTADAITLRTPIEGAVSGDSLRAGQHVTARMPLAQVEDLRVDDQRLNDLQQQLSRLQANVEAMAIEDQSLARLQADLSGRWFRYVEATRLRLAASVGEAEQTLAMLIAQRDDAEKTLKRREFLALTGYAATAELEKSQLAVEIAKHGAAGQASRIETLRAQLTALDQGVVSEPGSND